MTKLFVLCFSRYLCHTKKSTVCQISGLSEKTGSKSGIKWKMQLIQSNSFTESKKLCETMIHIFKLAKNRIFLFTCFNPLSPNSDQHQFSPNNIHMLPRD